MLNVAHDDLRKKSTDLKSASGRQWLLMEVPPVTEQQVNQKLTEERRDGQGRTDVFKHLNNSLVQHTQRCCENLRRRPGIGGWEAWRPVLVP